MKDQIYIVPRGNRYFLIRGDKKQVGSAYGYRSRESALKARWFLIQAKDVIKKSYQYKKELSLEHKHFKSI